MRIPRGAVGIEVAQDEGIILGCQSQKSVQRRRVVGRAGGSGRDVDVMDGYGLVVDDGSDGEMFDDVVCGEEVFGGEGSV